MSGPRTIGLIGFGEVGSILAEDLAARAEIAAFDIRFDRPDSGPSRNAAAQPKVRVASDAADATRRCGLVICAVTAAEDLNATGAFAPSLAAGTIVLDLNSVSPEVTRAAARIVEATGARYVEAAVMGPIGPHRKATPMLLGGPHAPDVLPTLEDLGFAGAEFYRPELGAASAAKMCRSVVIKGVEALLTESLLAARHYGVERTVLASLANLLPGADWDELARYMISRALGHGARRAEEMREVARTVADAGLEPVMSEASATRQAWAADFAHAGNHDDLDAMLDAIRHAMAAEKGKLAC